MRSWLNVPGDWRRPTVDERYAAVRCDSCGYGLLHPRPTPEQIATYYDVAEYYTHRKHRDRSDPIGFLDRVRRHLAWLCDNGTTLTASEVQPYLCAPRSRVIELGCGNGELLLSVRALGHDVVGVEPDPSAAAVARASGLRVYRGSAERLPQDLLADEGPGSFDIVLMRHVLEHCLDPLQALKSARALLKPTGRLLCETPNNDALGLRLAGASWHWLDVPRHINFFTGASLVAACKTAGLDVLSSDYCGYFRQFDKAWVEAEQHIQNTLGAAAIKTSAMARSWLLLARTLFASPPAKYDSVRVAAAPCPVS